MQDAAHKVAVAGTKPCAPVALIVFNRPLLTERVLGQVAQARPSKLLVIADGPRPTRPDDVADCAATRALFEKLDWDCELLTSLSETNRGCKRRVASGLDWVFQLCEEAIILEDDCVPDPSFFPFCTELLGRYREDERVRMISGTNLLGRWGPRGSSYFFSCNYSIWGWATWRRAWRHYDVDMKDWPELRRQGTLQDPEIAAASMAQVSRSFDAAHAGEIDTWDTQWSYACAKAHALEIVPRRNLVTNIGFGEDATHTRRRTRFADLRAYPMSFPLAHPGEVERTAEYERLTAKPPRSVLGSVLRRIRRYRGVLNRVARCRTG